MSRHAETVEATIGSFRRKLAGLIVLQKALTIGTVGAILWGLFLMAVRAVPGLASLDSRWAIPALAALGIAAIASGMRRLPSRVAVRTLLDRENRCGGLLMAGAAVDPGEWRENVPAVQAPRLRWRGGRILIAFAAAFLFLVFGLLLPESLVRPRQILDTRQEVAALTAQIELLREEGLLEKQRAEAFEQKLSEIAKEGEGADPAKTWEALDHLSESARALAGERAQEASARARGLFQAEALAAALGKQAGAFDAKEMAEAMAELSGRLEKAARENQGISEDLRRSLDAARAGSLSSEDLKRIADLLGSRGQARLHSLAKLYSAGLISAEALKRLQANAEGARGARGDLATFLQSNPGAAAVWCERPGRGGVDRGRADAEMSWAQPTAEEKSKFRAQALPPGALESLKESRLVGISAAEPSPAGKKAGAAAGVLGSSTPGGGTAVEQPVLPKHKVAVRRYFERPGRS